jgi:hypothetical protein
MANIFTQNPIRLDTVMGSGYLATIGASAGLERPLKVTEINVETSAAPAAAGPITITDAAGNTIWECQVAATANLNIFDDFQFTRMWRNFQLTVIPTNTVVWIYRR